MVARSSKTRQTVGSLGESIAAERLKAMGYRILEYNVRLPQGEIDIVARDRDVLAFVEVRTRRSAEMGLPEESITERKKQKLRQLVDSYHQVRSAGETQSRIDVVVIDLNSEGQPTRVEVIKSAVDG
ncbi:MAG: YraN family protein [Chloroflexota bacterium]